MKPARIVYSNPRSNPCSRNYDGGVDHHVNCIRDLGQCDCPCHIGQMKPILSVACDIRHCTDCDGMAGFDPCACTCHNTPEGKLF